MNANTQGVWRDGRQTEPGRETQMITTGVPHDPRVLLCPQCEHFNTHVDMVDVTSTNGTLRVKAVGEDEVGGFETLFVRTKEPGRRHTIGIHISCENGCNSVLSFQQHKGDTITRLIKLASEYPDRMGYPPMASVRGPHES